MSTFMSWLISLFHSTLSVFSGFVKEFVHILFMVLEHSHHCYFGVLVLSFRCITFLGIYNSRVPGFYAWAFFLKFNFNLPGEGIVCWLFMFVCLCWCLDTWNYDDWGDSRCGYLILSLLGVCSIPWFQCPLWISGKCGGCGFPVRGCFCRSVGGSEE